MNRIAHENLAAAVVAAAKFCPRARCQKPILRTVRVAREDGTTTVTATDLDLQVVIAIEGGSGSGASLIPVEATKAVVDSVWYDDKFVVVGDVTAFADEDPERYPCRPLLQEPVAAILWFNDVEWIAGAVATVTDDLSSRFELSGVCLEADGESVVAVATDGRRLHAIDSRCAAGCCGALDIISPPGVFTGLVRAVRAVARDSLRAKGRRLEAILESSTVKIRHSGSEVELRWCSDGVTVAVAGRRIKGRFPQWRDLLPAGDAVGVIDLQAKEGAEQLKAASRFQTERATGVLFRGGRITAGDKVTGTFSATIAGAMTGPAVKLNPKFVVEAIKAAGGEQACFHIHDDAVRLNCWSGSGARLRIAISSMAIDSES
jgi:DNA polymerase-3 subunit beta